MRNGEKESLLRSALIRFCHAVAGSKPTSCRKENFGIWSIFERKMPVGTFKSESAFFIRGSEESRTRTFGVEFDQKSENAEILSHFHIGDRIRPLERSFGIKIIDEKSLSRLRFNSFGLELEFNHLRSEESFAEELCRIHSKKFRE